MRGFICKLLDMTHAQWMCRNFSKHHHVHGTLQLKTRKEIYAAIENHLNRGIDIIYYKSRCLLEIDPQELFQMKTVSQ